MCKVNRNRASQRPTAISVSAALILGAFSTAPNLAVAQFGAVEEILVTAQRREQSSQDVGIAINAFAGEELRELGVTESVDIAKFSPGVFISSTGGGQNNQFSIRGVTQNDFNDATEAAVAVYVDEGYVPTQQGQTLAAFDLERAEVLKGPQGTLFGRNATGGLVHFIPNKPSQESEGYLDIEFGRFDKQRAEGAINIPINDVFSTRISGVYEENDPYLNNIFSEGDPSLGTPSAVTPGRERLVSQASLKAGRIQFQYQPNDTWSARFAASFADQRSGSAPYSTRATQPIFNDEGQIVDSVLLPEGTPILGFLGAIFPEQLPGFTGFVPPSRDSLDLSQDFTEENLFTTDNTNFSLHLNYSGDAFDFVSITDVKDFEKRVTTDVEASPINFINFGSTGDTESFSQEFRFSGETEKLNWTAGAYYLDIDTDVVSGFLIPSNGIFALLAGFDPFFETGIDLLNQVTLETTSASVFGHIEYALNDKWSLTAGLRFIEEEQDYVNAPAAFVNNNDFDLDTDTVIFPLAASSEDPVAPFVDARDTSLWAGKLQFDYRPTDDALIYFGINRGVKGGAYNTPLADGSPALSRDQLRYDEEILFAYEAGFKSTWANGKVQFNGAAYFYDYEDYQAFTFANVSGIVTNQDATTLGLELELNVQPTDRTRLGLGVSLIDNEVEDLEVAPNLVRDVEASFTPAEQVNGFFAYDIPLKQGSLITLSTDFSWISEYFDNIRNFSSQERDSYGLLNARVSWASENDQWSVTAFVNNVTDERFTRISFDLSGLCGCSEQLFGKPRWWGVKVGYKF